MSFKIYVQSCKHYHSENIEHFHHSKKLPYILFCSAPLQPPAFAVIALLFIIVSPFLEFFRMVSYIQQAPFCVWLLLPVQCFEIHLCCLVYQQSILFLLLSSIPSYEYTTISLFIPQLMDGWFVQFMAIVIKFAMNICICFCRCTFSLLLDRFKNDMLDKMKTVYI